MEAGILVWFHGGASPALDSLFRLSHAIGTGTFCVPLVLAAALWHGVRREPRPAVAWLVVGLLTWLLPELVKAVVGRPRPLLWPRLVEVSGFSFPSGHAVAGAALYPLLGWTALGSRAGARWLGYAAGLSVGVFVGVGRLYLGVHWPSDVLAGWALGVVLSLVAVAWLARSGTGTVRPGEDAAPGRYRAGAPGE